MWPTRTFHGATHRVQLGVLDHLKPFAFVVYVLNNRHHKSTSFRAAGEQVYFGDSVDAAWDAVRRYCPRAEWPREWGRFLRVAEEPSR